MAAKRRHWKEKNGRFWARISIPEALRPYFSGKTQLTEALGGDLRVADQKHAAAVARLQAQIARAAGSLPLPSSTELESSLRALTPELQEHAVWQHYTIVLGHDEQKRASMPTPEEIEAEHERAMKRIEAGEGDPSRGPVAVFNVSTDFELKAGARHFDHQLRARRLAALQAGLYAGDARLVELAVQKFVSDQELQVVPGSSEWRDLAHKFMRAEIDALARTLDRDRGNFRDTPTDPVVKQPASPLQAVAAIPLLQLFRDYIATRQAIGKHKDGGANWESVIVTLIKFLGHNDARKITRRNLLDWRDALMRSGKSPKTVSDKHLAAVSAILRWAFENEHLPTNEAQTVRQEVPRKVQSREKGYTSAEAEQVLRASISHKPLETSNPSNRESAHITAAKRWVPLLCAFTGARVTEITQLRKEDVREEGGRWILRITPDAGSVKTGQYRDVPLHRQVIACGFSDFVWTAEDGPLFHNSKTPGRYLAGARGTAGKLSQWLNELDLVPDGVQPSYGMRHRFKTQGLELGASVRVLDAIQGHPGKTASDGYGDVTIAAKLKVIDALPEFDLSCCGAGLDDLNGTAPP